MKLIATLCAALCGMSMMAQSDFQLQIGKEGDKVLTDGQTYEFGYEDELAGMGLPFSMYTFKPNIYIHALADIDALVEMTTQNESGWLCCAGGNCRGVTAANPYSNEVSYSANSTEDMQIHFANFDDSVVPTEGGEAKLTVTSDNEEMTIYLKAILKPADEVGVKAIATDGTYVKAFGRTIDYDLAAPTAMCLYTVDGRLAATYRVAGRGSVDVSLPAGVYVYRAGKLSGKMLVK